MPAYQKYYEKNYKTATFDKDDHPSLDGVNVRNQPHLDSKVDTVLPDGGSVRVTGEVNRLVGRSYYEVQYENTKGDEKTGYVWKGLTKIEKNHWGGCGRK